MFVYKHIRLDNNEVFYIGIGKDKSRAYDKMNRNMFWKRIILKTEYRIEIVCECKTWEDACEKEKSLILEYGRRDLGTGTLVNLTDGGDGNLGGTSWKYKKRHTKESRLKMSISHRNSKIKRIGKKHTLESKVKMSYSHTGKKLSNETKKKLSQISSLRKVSNETKQKMSQSHTGKKLSSETKKKMSDAKKGIPLSGDHYVKIIKSREKLKRPIIEIDSFGNFLQEYTSISEASQKTGYSRSTIRRRIQTKNGFDLK